MDSRKTQTPGAGRRNRARIGFTLIELLTVIAIITLLIGILVPALSRAREQARSAATRAILKSAGAGLDMFKNENPRECRGGGGYPSSSMRDDPTEASEQVIFGAQWLVRYLMGKNLDGYIPRRIVPRDMLVNPTQFHEQEDWYARQPTTANPHAPLERVGPYLEADNVAVALPKDLDGVQSTGLDPNNATDKVLLEQPVLLDSFGYPILYYAANTRLLKAMHGNAPIAGLDDTPGGSGGGEPAPLGIYTFADNGLFTGLCGSASGGPGTCIYPPWDFAGIGSNPGTHKLENFGDPDPNNIDADIHTFAYYILNKDVYESTFDQSTGRSTVAPYRRDTFILITPGPDGVYGTGDDVTNF